MWAGKRCTTLVVMFSFPMTTYEKYVVGAAVEPVQPETSLAVSET